jgi:putative ABC transport system permease protein
MISKESVKYSVSNLKKRKSRSFLTILSIFIGISAIFVFISFGLGLYDYVNSFITGTSADKIIIMPKGTGVPGLDDTYPLTDEDLRAIERTSGVYDVEGVKYMITEVQQAGTKKFTFVMGYDTEKNMMLEYGNMKIIKGRLLQKGEKNRVILGYNYMFDNKILPRGLDVNDRIRINEKDFTIIGFFDSIGNPQDDASIYLPLDTFSDFFPESKGYGMMMARVDINNIERTIENVENSLRKSKGLEKGKEDFTVSSFEEMLNSYSSSLDIIIGFIILIALISVLVSAVNTANTMITSVLERTKEIGVMKSIGAQNSEIFKIFLFESSLLGFVAGCIGVLFGFILTSIASIILTEMGWGFLMPHYSMYLFVGCILFATLTGAISGIYPAIKAAKANPVDSLRYE